jgi:hypothetical protein
MKHFKDTVWQAALGPLRTLNTAFESLVAKRDAAGQANFPGIAYVVKPQSIKTFAVSGQPFLTFYEFDDLAGWYRDTYFAPDNVPNYEKEVGTAYTVWTHETHNFYRRHIFPDSLKKPVTISFEITNLDTSAWFPLRIRVFDDDGLYFQCDQRLVVESLGKDGGRLTSWKKIPALRDGLPQLMKTSTAT